MEDNKAPFIGAMVRYVLAGSDLSPEFKHRIGLHRPAVVVDCNEAVLDVALTVFADWNKDGCFLNIPKSAPQRFMGFPVTAPYSAGKEPGTWHWSWDEVNGVGAAPPFVSSIDSPTRFSVAIRDEMIMIHPDGTLEGSNAGLEDFLKFIDARGSIIGTAPSVSSLEPNELIKLVQDTIRRQVKKNALV